MSSTLQKRRLVQARLDAADFRALFPPRTYERWEFAGSLRRGVQYVGDVEHVIIPKIGEVPTDDLFGTPVKTNLVFAHLDELVKTYTVQKHAYGADEHGQPKYRWGEKYRGVDFRSFNHEIFCADADNWGPTLAIRTGPGSFSKMLVTRLQRQGYINEGGYVWNKNAMTCACGWQGRFVDLTFHDAVDVVRLNLPIGAKPKWCNGVDRAGLCPGCAKETGLAMAKVSVPDERQYFDLCGVKWIEPAERMEVES